ncbi:MAG: uracil-DNA glycosylase family protein [Pseudomonadota bacterium]
MSRLLQRVQQCTICEGLPLGTSPLLQVSRNARVLIAGQAPGRRAHERGIPFDDPSGNRLRDWLGVDRDTFYDATRIGVLPMGFCFPGTGSSGDLPPRPECAENWRQPMLDMMPDVALLLVIGRYARDWHLPERKSESLTETIRSWPALGDGVMALPHPSPRNNRWLKKNPWFEGEVLDLLQTRVQRALTKA